MISFKDRHSYLVWRNFMKKTLITALALMILSGCATFVPFEPMKKEISIQDPSSAFESAVDCASRAVRPPSVGTMFTYQSEKYNKFILSFLMDSGSDFWTGTGWNVDAVMRYSTSSDGKTAILEVTDMKLCSGAYGCSSSVSKDSLPKYRNKSERIMNEIATCVESNNH